MSLPKTLDLAHERLDSAESTLQLHAEEVVECLTDDTEYRGLYEDEAISSAVKASTQAFNARQQFSRYEEDFEEAINSEKVAEEVGNEHDIAANTQQYKHAYESAAQVTLRYNRLHRQIKGLSEVMEQNDLGNLWEDIKEDHPWYMSPENSEGFNKASELV